MTLTLDRAAGDTATEIESIEDKFEAFIEAADFPCVGAKSASARGNLTMVRARDLRKRYDRRAVARVGGKRRFIGVDRGVEIALRLRRLALVHQRYGLGQDIIVGTLRIGGYRQAGQNKTGAKGQ